MKEMKKLQKTAGGQNEELLRDTYIEVDLDKLAANVVMIKDMVGPEIAITAVIKANGYGHGAWQIAQSIMDAGADYLAVATLTEALELREHAIDAPILIMGHTPDRLLPHVADTDDIFFRTGKAAQRAGRGLRTEGQGTHQSRYGFSPSGQDAISGLSCGDSEDL